MQCQCLYEDFWLRVRAMVITILLFYCTLHMTDIERVTVDLLIHFVREIKEDFEPLHSS